MQNDILVKPFVAEADIPANHIVTFGSAEETVVGASAVSETLIGVTHNTDTKAGDAADVVMSGTPMVKAGAAITKGTYVTVDSNSQAVGVSAGTDRTIGMALRSASAGDLIPVLLTQA